MTVVPQYRFSKALSEGSTDANTAGMSSARFRFEAMVSSSSV